MNKIRHNTFHRSNFDTKDQKRISRLKLHDKQRDQNLYLLIFTIFTVVFIINLRYRVRCLNFWHLLA